eukprot:327054-Chlamydomonas_euryale.AAC.6
MMKRASQVRAPALAAVRDIDCCRHLHGAPGHRARAGSASGHLIPADSGAAAPRCECQVSGGPAFVPARARSA